MSKQTGTVKWFSARKGFGFISLADEEAKDVFVHQTALHCEGYRSVADGSLRFVIEAFPSFMRGNG